MLTDINFDDYSVYELRCIIVEGKILAEDIVAYYGNEWWDDKEYESEYHD